MKKVYTFLAAMLIALTLWAQAPQKISYQAVIRNANNELVTSTEIGMRISILQGSADGTAVYTETLTPTTNANGLVSVEFGGGAGFEAIDWANGPFYIKTETDPSGSTSYSIVGVSQLLSVPFALYALDSGNPGPEGPQGPEGPTGPAGAAGTDGLSAYQVWLNLGNEGTEEDFIASLSDESDPLFSAWNKSTGISITESQISDLGTYIETETDPAVAANFDFTDAANGDLLQYNGTKWVKVTPDYISDYTVTETDVTAHEAALEITKNQIPDFGTYLETETDPTYTATFSITDPADGDLLRYNATSERWEKYTPDYAAGTHSHATATDVAYGFMSSADKTKLDDLQNVNISAGTGISVTGTYPNQTIASSHTLYLGQEHLDGIIFYLYIGSDGQQHGLVVSKTESTARWQNTGVLVNADGTEDGLYNTVLMTDSPAKDWVTGLGADWYLPSIDELSILWHNRFHVNKTARAIGSTLLSTTASYWSSTEYLAAFAFYFYFNYGYSEYTTKTSTSYSVRAVRAF